MKTEEPVGLREDLLDKLAAQMVQSRELADQVQNK